MQYITKGIGGFYYVRTLEGIVECKARGIFRKRGITPVAGDNVILSSDGTMIDEILPRKNVFVRPPVANLDILFIVASTTQPVPSTLVLDQLAAAAIYKDVQPGDSILIDDGLVGMEVVNIVGKDIVCRVKNGGDISDHKGVNVPGVELKMPFISPKDRDDLMFGIQEDFDFVAASFTRTADDVREMRKLLNDNGGQSINIIAKIENQQGVDNIDAIIEEADGIMVARGDMGVEIPLERVPIIQQRIIEKVYQAGKVVITATQMLDSMMVHPRPTRAETTDVANAIYQGTSAIMLSGETAAGKYPVEALKMMVKIAVSMEGNIDYNDIFRKSERSEDPDVTNAISHATCMTAIDLKAEAILAASKTGCTARMISKYRPGCPIGGCSSSEKVCRQLNMSWGIYPMHIKEEYSSEILCLRAIEAAKAHGLVKDGDEIVFAGGIPLGIPGRTNLIRVCIVGE